jgi:hypothetical protein
VKLRCDDEAMPELVRALWEDQVPAWMAEITGTGWHIELLRPHDCPELQKLVDSGVVVRG